MNYHLFFGAMILILAARLRLTFRDEGSGFWDAMIMGTFPLFVIMGVSFGTGWVLLFGWLLIQHPLINYVEQSGQRLNSNRLLLLLLNIIVIGALSGPYFNWSPSELLTAIRDYVEQNLLLNASTVDWLKVEVALFGLLLALNESNIVIRWLLNVFNLEPLSGGDNEQYIDQQEYNTGRVIGFLERVFYFVFILLNQYAAIGFLLTAKGVTRFQEFNKNRTFAEYVLIGTLLSALLAMVSGYIVVLFI